MATIFEDFENNSGFQYTQPGTFVLDGLRYTLASNRSAGAYVYADDWTLNSGNALYGGLMGTEISGVTLSLPDSGRFTLNGLTLAQTQSARSIDVGDGWITWYNYAVSVILQTDKGSIEVSAWQSPQILDLRNSAIFTDISYVQITGGYTVDFGVDNLSISYSGSGASPAIASAAYDASAGILTVTGSDVTSGGTIDVSKLTVGVGSEVYTLTSSNVTAASSTAFAVALNAADRLAVSGLLNKAGQASADGQPFYLSAAANWDITAAAGADASNPITVSNVPAPAITSATYDAGTHVLAVTGTHFAARAGGNNDINIGKLVIIGEGGTSYTLTSADVDVTSASSFSVTLNAADRAALGLLLNKNGSNSAGGASYNLAAAEDWAAGADAAVVIADLTGNPVTVSNLAPRVTDANVSLSGATGARGAFLIGDTVTAIWDNSPAGDNNTDTISSVTVNFSQFGGGSAVAATEVNGRWIASFQLTGSGAAGSARNVSVTATDNTGHSTTVADSSNATVSRTSVPSISGTTVGGVSLTRTVRDIEGVPTVSLTVPEITPEIVRAATRAVNSAVVLSLGEPLNGSIPMSATIPTGVQLTANTFRPVSLQALETVTIIDDAPSAERFIHSTFLPRLPAADNLVLHHFTLALPPSFSPGQPIVLQPAGTAGTPAAVIIDGTGVPAGTHIRLDGVDYAAITGAVKITGGAGSNAVWADDAAQVIVMGAMDDELHGGGGNDEIGSRSGNDRLYGDDGDDYVHGGSGNDTLHGGSGDDRLDGGAGRDTASYEHAAAGVRVSLAPALINGHRSQDTQGDGIDTLRSIEHLTGSAFDDLLTGNSGANRLDGGDGDDVLGGEAGNDTLVGGSGADTLTGGSGRDSFVFNTLDELGDTIADFSRTSDRLLLSGTAFGQPVGKLAASAFIAGPGAAAQTAEQRFVYDTGTGSLYFDADGSGTDAAVLIAVLQNQPVLGAAHIVIV